MKRKKNIKNIKIYANLYDKSIKRLFKKYKVTGVFIARQARKLLQNKQDQKLEKNRDEEER